jgi:probable rRNA maturation factor
MGKRSMKILIDNRQNRFKVPVKKLRLKAQAILSALGCPDGELSLVITDDPQIRLLNRDYLNRDNPTNVIAFPMREGLFSDISPDILGDVVISADTVDREAKAAGIDYESRFDQLLVHGVLHLFGFDHENDDEKAEEMEIKSNHLLEFITTL